MSLIASTTTKTTTNNNYNNNYNNNNCQTPAHAESEQTGIGAKVLGNSLLWLVCLHRLLICSLRTTWFVPALCCAHSLGCLLAYPLPSWKKSELSWTDPKHYGSEQPRIGMWVLGHLLVCSLVCSHCSLICLLRPARFAYALRCAHLFARSFTHFRAHGDNDELVSTQTSPRWRACQVAKHPISEIKRWNKSNCLLSFSFSSYTTILFAPILFRGSVRPSVRMSVCPALCLYVHYH